MINFSFSENKLVVKDNKINFQSPIKKVLDVGDRLLVLVQDQSTRDSKKHGNIYGVNVDGKKIWVIQPTKPFGGWYRPFTGIYMRDNDAIAYSPIGIEYKINLDNGELIDIPGQRPW